MSSPSKSWSWVSGIPAQCHRARAIYLVQEELSSSLLEPGLLLASPPHLSPSLTCLCALTVCESPSLGWPWAPPGQLLLLLRFTVCSSLLHLA